LGPDDLRDHIGTLGAGLAEAWREDRPAVVHTRSWTAALAALVAIRERPIPLVRAFGPGELAGHLGASDRAACNGSTSSNGGRSNGGGSTHQVASIEQVRLERAICRQASHLIVGCGDDRDELTTSGITPAKATVVPTAIDVERFSPHGPAYPRTGRPRLVSIGPPGPDGGEDTAIHAMRMLPNAELVIAGDLGRLAGKGTKQDMPDNDGGDGEAVSQSERDRLMALAHQYSVDERVRVLNHVRADTLPALIRSADAVLCIPARPTAA
jgi:glycosyltransferase involved in cell wall biosynthesis